MVAVGQMVENFMFSTIVAAIAATTTSLEHTSDRNKVYMLAEWLQLERELEVQLVHLDLLEGRIPPLDRILSDGSEIHLVSF